MIPLEWKQEEKGGKWLCVSGVDSRPTVSWRTQQSSPRSSLGLEAASLALRQPREPLTDDIDILADRFPGKQMTGDQMTVWNFDRKVFYGKSAN